MEKIRGRKKKLEGMTFAATSRCPCGAGLAYDETCVQEPFRIPSYWDCSAILLMEADPNVTHTDRLPFSFYEIKAEGQPSANGATTRPHRETTVEEIVEEMVSLSIDRGHGLKLGFFPSETFFRKEEVVDLMRDAWEEGKFAGYTDGLVVGISEGMRLVNGS